MNAFAGQFEQILIEAMVGLFVMSLVAMLNLFSFTEIALGYRRHLRRRHFQSRYLEMVRFIAHVMLLVFAQFLSLTIWAVALIQFNFVDDWMTAIMLTASFFTSVGNFTVNLPVAWRLIPSAIAFTGMFSFAWATAWTLSMARDFSEALEQHKEL